MSVITELRVSNFMRISTVRIRPDGSVVTVTGATDQGKTSVLKSIWTLLEGKASAPAVLIREGEEQCVIHGEFDDGMKVTRTFTRVGDEDVTMSLKIVEADGMPVRGKQQATLDKLIGAYTFDPLAFAKAPAKVQFDTLKQFVAGVDFDKMAAQRKKNFDERTDANRRAKEFRTLAERIALPPGPCPKATDVAAALALLADANAFNAKIPVEKQKRFQYEVDIRANRQVAIDKRARAADLRLEAEKFEEAAVAIDEEVERQEKFAAALTPLPEPIDTTEVQARIADAERIKGIRLLHENRRHNEDEAERWEGEADALTAKIDDLDRQKVEAVAAAKMPVDGIGFGDNEILLNGIPFTQAGTAMKIKTSVAIGMSMKPELKVMTIDEGSELGESDIAIIEELAKAHGFQVWIVRVDEHAKKGLIMEDGHLAHAEAAE